MSDLEKFAHAFLVADDVLARRAGKLRSSIFGIEIVSDERMPVDCWALGNREGAVVVQDVAEFIRQFRRAGGTEL